MAEITFTTEDLPSRGLFYDNIYTITLKSLTLGDYKELMKCNDRYFKVNIINVLSNTVISNGLNVSDMYYGDVMALLMWYKCNSSVDTNLKLRYKCSCKNSIDLNVNLGEFEQITLDEYTEKGVLLPSGKYLEYQPKTFLEYEKSTDKISHICNVFKYLNEYEIDEMDVEDFLYLQNKVKNFRFGFRYDNNTVCRMCRNKYDIHYELKYDTLFKHIDYNSLIRNILSISKYTNYQMKEDEQLFDFETSVNVVNEMLKDEEEEYEKLSKK